MVTIGMNYMMLPGKGQVFEDMFTKVLVVMDEMDGHSKSSLYCDVNNKQIYLIVSEWSSEDDFNAFIGSEKFKNVVDWGKENILAARPSHKVYKH